MQDKRPIIVLDFGAQYSQLIARRVRECHVYSVILPYDVPVDRITDLHPQGIILSGGPASVHEPNSPQLDKAVFELDVAVLGICYGLQLMAHMLGGKVLPSDRREYGRALLRHSGDSNLFTGLEEDLEVWMSHGDKVEKLPNGFQVIGSTENCPVAAFASPESGLYGVQFHPEVVHTPKGTEILKNFVFGICGSAPDWTAQSFVDEAVESIRARVGEEQVVCAVSGGVDSTVVAVLVQRAVGDKLHCIFVNNGVLRKGEADEVRETFGEHFHIPLHYVDAEDRFLEALAGIIDPEEKRKRIGNEFIRVFESEAEKLGKCEFLAQGTLYPDVIESVSATGGPSATIKTHHNVGGLPERMDFELIEPLRELFKDEVREVGLELGIPESIVWRHPFPGPGLAIRVLGEVTKERLDLLREADAIAMGEIRAAGLYRKMWQALVVLLPVRSVGVMGDGRTYEDVVAVRTVSSKDAMTADWYPIPHDVLARISNRIINEVAGVNRVVYDISSKPPSTIEWE